MPAPATPVARVGGLTELGLVEPAPQVDVPTEPDLVELDFIDVDVDVDVDVDPAEPAPREYTDLAEPDLAEPAPRVYTDADMAPATSRTAPTWPDPDRTRPSGE
jgi:hypothetical protein